MTSFYSIFYVSIKPEIQEKVAVGLWTKTDKEVFFEFSEQKLKIIKDLLNEDSYHLLKNAFLSFKKNIQDIEKQRIEYFAKYNHNLILISEPKPIDLKINQQIFEKLYAKWIESFPKEVITEDNLAHSFYQKIKKELFPKIKDHVNTNFELNSQIIPTLILPVKVDFIGKNEIPVTGKSIFFDKKDYYLRSDIMSYFSLINSLKTGDFKQIKCFVVGDEPKNKFDKRHDAWKQIHSSKIIELVPTQELDRISDYISTHQVMPFIDKK
jgi:hypothetical protein